MGSNRKPFHFTGRNADRNHINPFDATTETVKERWRILAALSTEIRHGDRAAVCGDSAVVRASVARRENFPHGPQQTGTEEYASGGHYLSGPPSAEAYRKTRRVRTIACGSSRSSIPRWNN